MMFALEAVNRIESEKDRPHAALIEVVSWCTANQSRFWGRHERSGSGAPIVPSRGWAGSWDSADEWVCISLLPATLREILEPVGYQTDEITERWGERKWLMSTQRMTKSGRTVSNFSATARIHGAPMRVVQIPRSIIDTHVAAEEMEAGDYLGSMNG